MESLRSAVTNIEIFWPDGPKGPDSLMGINCKELGLNQQTSIFQVSGKEAYMRKPLLEKSFIYHTAIFGKDIGKYSPKAIHPVSCLYDAHIPVLNKFFVIFPGFNSKGLSGFVLVGNFRGIYSNVSHLAPVLQNNGITINDISHMDPF